MKLSRNMQRRVAEFWFLAVSSSVAGKIRKAKSALGSKSSLKILTLSAEAMAMAEVILAEAKEAQIIALRTSRRMIFPMSLST